MIPSSSPLVRCCVQDYVYPSPDLARRANERALRKDSYVYSQYTWRIHLDENGPFPAQKLSHWESLQILKLGPVPA
jgi:hypothetical protein